MSSNSHVKRYFLKAKATWVPEYIDARSVQFAGSHVVFRDGTNTRAIRADLLLDIRVNEAAPDE